MLVIGTLNALVRPAVLLVAENLGLAVFALTALVLNALIVLLAALVLPGFAVDTLWTALLLAFGLAIINTVCSGLLGINDDDSFYRNVIRWLERRRAPASDLDAPGTVLIQIDGLAEPILRGEIDAGRMPTLARWIASGSHRLARWECDVPSMTTSGQSGILYGNNANIPAFRWYEKSSARLIVSNHPRDALLIDQRQATDHGLLRDHGSSVGNILTGGAEHCVVTMSRLENESGQITASARDLYDYFVNPYNLYRGIGAMVWELGVEQWQRVRQRLRDVRPRMDRGGSYPFVRAVTGVLLRDITTWTLIADMFAGRRIAYADYLGYDEVAHHAGPATPDARDAAEAGRPAPTTRKRRPTRTAPVPLRRPVGSWPEHRRDVPAAVWAHAGPAGGAAHAPRRERPDRQRQRRGLGPDECPAGRRRARRRCCRARRAPTPRR